VVRGLFQEFIACLGKPETADIAALLGGYDLTSSGKLVWGQARADLSVQIEQLR